MKIAVLLSGGVDSSVALRLLKEQGHELTAFYLKIWLQDEFSFLGDCPWEDDLKYVRAVCEDAGVPFEVINMQKEYWDTVVKYTIDEIEAGRTPNPDMFCNRLIKFGQFIDKIDSSYDKVASGHYANAVPANGSFIMTRSPDPVKDQTYFLAYLTQSQLARALFPIGGYTKKEIRELAGKYDLPNKTKKDSQGICFLGQIKFKDFVKFHLGDKPGDIINADTGEVMGTHDGYYFYTIGQRQGLRLGGGPWYVVRKDTKKNIIYISHSSETADRARSSFSIADANWISGSPPEKEELQVKIRHGATMFNCRLTMQDAHHGTVTMDQADKGVAAGQFAVFYDGEVCLGGAVIAG